MMCCNTVIFFFFKQKTAYEMRISDWSSDVCSSDLAHAVNHGELPADEAELAEAVQMVPGPQNGRYTITAAWLDKPLVVRGKVNAETKFAEIKDAGAPLGWIAGGTKVEIEETGGGWYAITAPWLDDAEKVQGRDAAETRQREIHAAGEPDNYKGVTLTAGENGWYVITRDGSDTELKVHGEEQARADAATLRAGGTIEGDPLTPAQEGEDGQQGAAPGTDPTITPPDATEGAGANSANAGSENDGENEIGRAHV